jgi:DNA-directed RNA polymerase alpha subunit
MSERERFTTDEARRIGEQIGIDWAESPFDVEQFRAGMDVELEHGLHDPETNVSDDDPHVTAKIARAHLKEFPDYYTRLERMEEEAKRDWSGREATRRRPA